MENVSFYVIPNFHIIPVVDINDSGVVLEKNLYQAKISESVPLGHVVAKISAYDPDSVDFVKYSIIGHSYHQSPFDIDAGTGKKNEKIPPLNVLRDFSIYLLNQYVIDPTMAEESGFDLFIFSDIFHILHCGNVSLFL